MIFSPSCCCRLPEMDVILPKVVEPTLVFGLAGICVLVTSNDSRRNCSVARSRSRNSRCKLVSKFHLPGPKPITRPPLPHVLFG